MATATQTFSGTYGRLAADGDGIAIEGSAPVQSISIKAPARLREQVIEEFFFAGEHPDVSFRSTAVELGEDDTARVSGELTMRGIDWQLPLPNGGDAVGWQVELTADLELTRQA